MSLMRVPPGRRCACPPVAQSKVMFELEPHVGGNPHTSGLADAYMHAYAR